MLTFFQFAIIANFLALGYSHSQPGFQFQCDTPDEWLDRRSIYPGQLWPNGRVTYELHSSLTSNDTTEIFKAFYDIQNKTCIRFVPRASNESAYVSIEHDDNTCGVAHVCRTGGYQFARFGGGCVFANVMIHELGHTLCLGHEQTRYDRDDFVHFDPCREDETPGRDDYETRGHFYDYTSQMHYQCNWCPGGWPKMEGVSRCGMDVQEGLSVLDADKVNDFYDCQEACLSHRWRRTENLTEADKESIVPFGQTNDGEPLFLCRTYVGGEIAPGKYNLNSSTCFVSFNGTEYAVTEKVQIFAVPNGNTRGNYKPLSVDGNADDDLVPVGRTPNGVSEYAAVAIVETDGSREVAIGKVYGNDMTQAYIPFQGKELVFYDFEVIGCN